MEFHRYANIFPLMNDKEFKALVEDMKVGGYDKNFPIFTYENKILDGRNRYNASLKAKVNPEFVEFDGDNALDFVIRSNIHRRHLDISQRAALAAKVANMSRGGVRTGQNTLASQTANLQFEITQAQAASLFGVSERMVAEIKAIGKEAPEFLEEIEKGNLTVNKAKKKVIEKKNKKQKAKAIRQAKKVRSSDRWKVYDGDIKNWKAPRQYDFIITDPPYPKEFLSLYETLAVRAGEWLKDGGILVAMCGQSYLDKIISMMSKHMDYYWTGAYLTPGQPTPLRQKQVNTTWKPLLMFTKKGDDYRGKTFNDVFVSDPDSMKTDKNFHDWGQSISGMYAIVKMMCLPGQYILDPFCGSGTTGIASLKHGCLFDGLDLDKENCKISKARLDDETKVK